MRLDLSEIFACPACGPPQGLVVLVDRLEGGRVVAGELGCPICEARHPIADGVACFARPPLSEGGAEAPVDPERAVRLAALLGTAETRGVFLLGPGLSASAEGVSRLAADSEVLAVHAADVGVAGRAGITPIVVDRIDRLPVLDGRLRGAAFGGAGMPSAREAVRILVPGGRLVVLDPPRGLDAALPDLGLALRAVDARALVAERRG